MMCLLNQSFDWALTANNFESANRLKRPPTVPVVVSCGDFSVGTVFFLVEVILLHLLVAASFVFLSNLE